MMHYFMVQWSFCNFVWGIYLDVVNCVRCIADDAVVLIEKMIVGGRFIFLGAQAFFVRPLSFDDNVHITIFV